MIIFESYIKYSEGAGVSLFNNHIQENPTEWNDVAQFY